MTIAKSTVANAAAEEGTSQQERHGHITTWCRCGMYSRRFWIISESECRRQMSSCRITAVGAAVMQARDVLEQLSAIGRQSESMQEDALGL